MSGVSTFTLEVNFQVKCYCLLEHFKIVFFKCVPNIVSHTEKETDSEYHPFIIIIIISSCFQNLLNKPKWKIPQLHPDYSIKRKNTCAMSYMNKDFQDKKMLKQGSVVLTRRYFEYFHPVP